MTKTNQFHSTPKIWLHLKEPARAMRRAPTGAERVVWDLVRDRQVADCKFRRQYTIGRFIVDFACLEQHLVLEIDGPIHKGQQTEDAIRQAYLKERGFRIERFENAEVLENPASVRDRIRAAISQGD